MSPVPSTMRASAGAFTLAPTAAISPLRTTTVPCAIVAPVPGTIVALVMAYVSGTLRVDACAAAVGGGARVAASATIAPTLRERKVCMREQLLEG